MNQLKENKSDDKTESGIVKRTHIKSIDGLRGISVLFVMLYHLMPHVFEGGYLGVIVFFVLSGYFLTDNLLSDLEAGGRFSLFQFWRQRFSKLYLPYLPFLCIVCAIVLGFYHQALEGFSYNLLSSVFGVNNIYQITHQLSYFENYGKLNPFTHLWFMGVEIQFYLIFPLVLSGLYKVFSKHRGQMVFMIFAMSIFSALMMYANYLPNIDISRIYYGSDTRVFSLLIGSMFAILFPKLKIVNLKVSMWMSSFYSLVSVFFGGILCASMYYIRADFEYLYPFVMYGLSLLSGLFIVLLMIPGNFVAKILSLSPISTIGKRSYSLYLWQYAIMIFVNHEFLWSKISKWNLLAINLAITFVIAEISYQLFEKKRKRSLKFLKYKFRMIVVSSVLGIAISVYLPAAMPERFHYEDDLSELKERISQLEEKDLQKEISTSREEIATSQEEISRKIKENNEIIANADNVQDTDEILKKILEKAQDENPESLHEDYQPREEIPEIDENTQNSLEQENLEIKPSADSQGENPPEEKFEENVVLEDSPEEELEGNAVLEDSPEEELEGNVVLENSPEEVNSEEKSEESPSSNRFSFVGDSVMLGAKPSIQQNFPNSYVNAKVSRQAWHLGSVLNEMGNQNQLYENVVIHLGTNGYIDKPEFIRVLKNLGDRNIYLINSVVPRSWEESVNSVINEVAAELSNVHVIDWYSLAKGKREWFYKDAIHPNFDGIEKYTQLIKNSVK